MNHLEQDDIILFYYGEAPEGLELHLKDCEKCMSEWTALQRTLNTVNGCPTPEPSADFEQRMWTSVRPQLCQSAPAPRPMWHLMAVAASVLLMVAAAFVLGRSARVPTPPSTSASLSQMRQQLLTLAVGDHLSRSEAVLTELLNTPDAPSTNIAQEQARAEELISANRIFRQTANHAGDVGTETILEDLEQVLLEIAHSPTILRSAEWKDLRKGIEDRGILFKVRVVESQMKEREAAPPESL